MWLVAVGACFLALLLGCGGRSGGTPEPQPDPAGPAGPSLPVTTPEFPSAPPVSEGSPPASDSPPEASESVTVRARPSPPFELTCAERRYTFPAGPVIEGPVPCSGEVCVESASNAIGEAFVAGDRGSLWVIGSTGIFLRQDRDGWVSTCPPAGSSSVTAAFGARGDDVWVGGLDGYLSHWDGLAWIRTHAPAAGRTIGALWGDAREAFAVAHHEQVEGVWPPRSRGPLLRWDGSAWSDTGATGASPWGNGAGKAWALGSEGALEWNGATWQPVRGFPEAAGTVHDLWAPPGGDLWVLVNGGTTRTRVLRRVSGAFVDTELPPPYPDGEHLPKWIRGSSDGDVWAATLTIGAPRAPLNIWRWDGASWTKVPPRLHWRSGLLPPHVLPGGDALVFLNGLERLHGGPGEPALATEPLHFDLVGAAGGEVWLVGWSGVWRLEGRSFRRIDVGVSHRLVRSIAIRARDDAWFATGVTGELLHWDGAAVERIPRPAQATAPPQWFGVAPAGARQAWLVGGRFDLGERDCSLWRWDGAWATLPMPLSSCPSAIASGPGGDLWLAEAGTVWHRRADGTWERHDLPARRIGHLVVPRPDEAWAAGDGVHRWDGVAWRATTTMIAYGFSAGAPDDAWAFALEADRPSWVPSRDARLWHWDGREWTVVPTGIPPEHLAAVGGGELWGAGSGSVLHVRAGADR